MVAVRGQMHELADVSALAAAVDAALADEDHRMTIGLRSLDLDEWIEDLPDFDAQLREKQRVLDGASDVIGALDGSHAAQAELLALLRAHLLARFPQRYRATPDALVLAATGATVSTHAEVATPIANAGHLVPEDLCLMRADDSGAYCLVAAALAFPTRWRLAEKMGKPMLAIHAPVPGYGESIGKATDALMAGLKVERPRWRLNWSVVDAPDLHQPTRPPMGVRNMQKSVAQQLWVRTERQTLRRLPESGDVLFTIRIRQVTVAQLCKLPGAAGRLLAHMNAMPEALKAYKRISDVKAVLGNYLERQAASDSWLD
jgi:dimethylamine monooxygenase subunit A